MRIVDNIAALETRISAACASAGRRRSDVTLIAVTKTRAAAEIDEAIRTGITQVGENRVQEAAAKKPQVALPATWHLVGNLQTNKAKKALELFDCIQSVDSLHLAEELQHRCSLMDKRVDVLIEVNTSGEASKHGVSPAALPDLVAQMPKLDRLQLAGLMTIGPGLAIEDPEASRPCFKALRALAAACRQRFSIPLPHLSMGMSSDFEVAIEEGATMIRVGTAIFGQRSVPVKPE
ncbi:YggS family pyridoxal phosphate-dependent enzyme [candidate division WOR-3 bacterium]|uniref:Pyridoxal phosphate homeostasis protein n=1 Tax=candidate division WOR-3 bacterium TaxID=2052148 RepID=A0A937XH80_UNCW3|nr:YggS family pyridoxal phosphate-dependent enzyme [candidate division WOR-3 bacterium]